MKVTIYFHIIDAPLYENKRIQTWEGELTENEYNHFKERKMRDRSQYNDIRAEYPEADDLFQHDHSAQEELCALNYDILRESLPQWCDYALQYILEDQQLYHPNIPLTVGNIDVDGCRFG